MRVLVVDDEPAARRKLVRFLQDESGIEILGEASNGREAMERIVSERPDLVFLDIHMPDMDGFEVVEALAQSPYMPSIVFATAHDDYAVRAFEVSAVDYLLKPFDRERFGRALARARKSVGSNVETDQTQLMSLLEALRPPGRYLRRLLVPHAERSVFVNVADIVRLESDRNDVTIHTRRGAFALRATLESMEQKLDPEQFVRIHRSHLVNLDAVREVHPWFHGDYKVVLHDGTELMWSRRYAAKRPDLVK
jgi:two-component system, LytTR family, response regulator